jgi:hypothetical protein
VTDQELLAVLKATAATDEYRESLLRDIARDDLRRSIYGYASRVPAPVRELWGRMSLGQRAIVFLFADALDDGR